MREEQGRSRGGSSLQAFQVGIRLPFNLANLFDQPLVPNSVDSIQVGLQFDLLLISLDTDRYRDLSVRHPCSLAGVTACSGILPEPPPFPLSQSLHTDPLNNFSSDSHTKKFWPNPAGEKFWVNLPGGKFLAELLWEEKNGECVRGHIRIHIHPVQAGGSHGFLFPGLPVSPV